LAIRFSIGEKSSDSLFETGTLLFLAYATFGLTAMGYFFWDLAMRYGSVTLLGSVSYALPVTNIMLACFFLDVPLTWNLTAGALTVVAGAVLSHKGISTRKTD
jgi:drug/metabolite transporter (DMT)-like permease